MDVHFSDFEEVSEVPKLGEIAGHFPHRDVTRKWGVRMFGWAGCFCVTFAVA